jgi:hypothetical protein
MALGTALGATGSVMKMVGANKDRTMMNRASEAELYRQAGLQGQANQVFNQSLNQSKMPAMQGQWQDSAKQYSQAGQQGTFNPQRFAIPSQGGNVSMANTMASNRLAQGANAQQQGLGGIALAQGLKDQDVNNRLGLINNASQLSNQALPAEMQQASHAGDSLSNWGGILGALGSIVGAAGGGQAGGKTSGSSMGTNNLTGGASMFLGQMAPQQNYYQFGTQKPQQTGWNPFWQQ